MNDAVAGEDVNPRYLRRMRDSLNTLLTESGQELDDTEISRYQRTIEAAADELEDKVINAESESSVSDDPSSESSSSDSSESSSSDSSESSSSSSGV